MVDLKKISITEESTMVTKEEISKWSVTKEWLSTYIVVGKQPILPMLTWKPNVSYLLYLMLGSTACVSFATLLALQIVFLLTDCNDYSVVLHVENE